MKKILLMVVAALLATTSLSAQNSELKNEIGISYGVGISTIGDGLGDAIGMSFAGLMGTKAENESRFGTLAVEYFRHANNDLKFAFGGIGTIASFGSDLMEKGQKTGDRNRYYISLIPAIKYSWVNNEHFAFYSKIGIGGTLAIAESTYNGKSDTANKVYFAYQVSPVGIEFGGAFRGFVELGVGEQGIILGGVKYKF